MIRSAIVVGMNQWQWIDTPQALEHACEQFKNASALYIDTEFHREKTYYPEFALLQIYAPDCPCCLIDPRAIKDLSPLWQLLHQEHILKVLHAGRQDIEIIYQLSGKIPMPLFDTQVAAALLGYGLQVGLGNLLQRLLSISVAKQESFSDWMERPLHEKQLEYAAQDVLYLPEIHQHLAAQLQQQGRDCWLDEEQSVLCATETYTLNLDTVFWRVKGCNKLKPAQLAALRSLAAWREQEAIQRNTPRRRIVSDEILIEMARKPSLSIKHMERIRGMHAGWIKRFGSAALQAWQQGHDSPEDSWPKVERQGNQQEGTGLRMELLDALLRLRADELAIAAQILCDKSQLSALASWGRKRQSPPPKVKCLQGWRRQLIGQDLLRLLNGEICLQINPDNGKAEISERSDAASTS